MKNLELKIQMKKEKIPILVTNKINVTRNLWKYLDKKMDQMWTHTRDYSPQSSLIEPLDLLEQTTMLIVVLF
jgi:hypothetical protein